MAFSLMTARANGHLLSRILYNGNAFEEDHVIGENTSNTQIFNRRSNLRNQLFCSPLSTPIVSKCIDLSFVHIKHVQYKIHCSLFANFFFVIGHRCKSSIIIDARIARLTVSAEWISHRLSQMLGLHVLVPNESRSASLKESKLLHLTVPKRIILSLRAWTWGIFSAPFYLLLSARLQLLLSPGWSPYRESKYLVAYSGNILFLILLTMLSSGLTRQLLKPRNKSKFWVAAVCSTGMTNDEHKLPWLVTKYQK